MEINKISNNNFGSLYYPKNVHAIMKSLIANEIKINASRIITRESNKFFDSDARNIDAFIKRVQIAKEKYSNRTNSILKQFATAIDVAAKSKDTTPRLALKYYDKKKILIATVDNAKGETSKFYKRKYDDIFHFMQKISDTILNK